MMEEITLASTCVLHPDLLLLCWLLTELLEYKLERRYIEGEKVDTSNINLQTGELHCNYLVYIPSPRKVMYMEHGLQCNSTGD